MHGISILFGTGASLRFEVRDALGPVWLDDVVIDRQPLAQPPIIYQPQILRSIDVHLTRLRAVHINPSPGLLVQDSGVEIVASVVAAGRGSGISTGSQASAGLLLRNSRVLLVDCDIQGGDGTDAIDFWAAGIGGAAVRAEAGSVVHAHGALSRYQGGKGGDDYLPWRPGAGGGNGIDLFAADAHCLGIAPRGGMAGTGAPPGSDGVPYRADAQSTLVQLAVPGPTASLVGVPGPGNLVRSSLAAQAGDVALLFFGFRHQFVPVAGLITHGALLCTLDVLVDPLLVPGSGVLDVPWPMPREWPIDDPIPFQFAVIPVGRPEVWTSNAVPVLVRS